MTVARLSTRIAATFRTSAALGLRPLTAPLMVFIPLGVLLGPGALGILSSNALAHMDIVVSTGLATLGVFIGIAAGRDARKASRLFLASTIEAGITILVVAAAILALLSSWGLALELPSLLVALALGVCASASAAPHLESADERTSQIAARVADLDDVLPIVVGGLVLVMVGGGDRSPLVYAMTTVGLGFALGLAGWLLVERAHGVAERAVFVLGALTLLGGAPAYLGLSPLLTGLSAGLFWVIAPGQCDVVVARELRKVQHPLVVLLLIVGGAWLTVTPAGVWLFAPYVVFRFAGKILGGWTASRIAPGVAPSDLGAYLMSPGVIGIAFALNLHQVADGAADAIVFAVSAGAIACEALAVIVNPASRPA